MNDKSALLPVLAALIALGSAACLKTEAKTPAAMPALTVPVPPSRTLVPWMPEPEEPVPPPPNPSATAPVPKPDNPPAPPVPPRTTPTPASPPPANAAEPPLVVQAAATTKMKELEARVVKTLDEATPMLEKLKAVPLSREATDQLTTALSHVKAAREALAVNNIPFANELAQKALTLAKQLGGGK